MAIEGLIVVVIAGLISLMFKKLEKKEPPKTNKQKLGPENSGPAVSSAEIKPRTTSAVRAEKQKPVDVSGPVKKQKKEPLSVIETWTKEDVLKGIVLSEILGPPKSKRKK